MEQGRMHEISPPTSPAPPDTIGANGNNDKGRKRSIRPDDDVVKNELLLLSPIGLPLDGTNSDDSEREKTDTILPSIEQPADDNDDTATRCHPQDGFLPFTPPLGAFHPPSQHPPAATTHVDPLQMSGNSNNDVVSFLPDESPSTTASSAPEAACTMEERIQELETKLAVVSRLLQSYSLQPRRRNHDANGGGGTSAVVMRSGTPPLPSTPLPPPESAEGVASMSTPELPSAESHDENDNNNDDDDPTSAQRRHRYRSESINMASTPYLESPLPLAKPNRKSYLERALLDDGETDCVEDPLTKQGAEHVDNSDHHHHPVTLSPSQQPQTTTTNSNLGPTLSAFMAAQQPVTTTSSPSSTQIRPRCMSMDETVAFDNRTSVDSSTTASNTTKEAPSRTTTTANTTDAPTTSESPPQKKHSRRNLSFRLLYASDEEDEYLGRNGPTTSTNSLSLSERLWLGGSIKLFQNQHRQEDAAEISKARRARNASGSGLASIPQFQIKTPPDEKVRTKWLDYLNSFQESTPDVDVQMEEFIKVPAGVEYVMSYGFFICVDSFLYMITVLPIRFVWSCFLLLLHMVFWWNPRWNASPQFRFHRQHVYQLIQVTILYTIYRYVLWENSIGKLYHWIRGQAMLKLYVLIAIVEVFDRLFSSLGQDCLDSMYWNTVSRPHSRRMLISVLVVMIYAAIHSILLFVHVVTLHVAMNSTDHVLLTLLISGNFAEIKSTVFKKYNKAALSKITFSDICERFKLSLFLSLVLLLNFCQGMNQGQFMGYIRICGIVCGAEVLADWIKHAFITKFNFLPARVYREYSLLLAGDVTGIGHEGVNLDNSHAVVKRIGFAQIPLVCVLFRLIREAAKYAVATLPDSMLLLRPWFAPLLFVGVWSGLLMVKLFLGGLLQRISLGMLLAAPEYSQQTPLSKKKKLP